MQCRLDLTDSPLSLELFLENDSSPNPINTSFNSSPCLSGGSPGHQISRFPAPPCFHPLSPRFISSAFIRTPAPPSGQWFPGGKLGILGDGGAHPFQSVTTQPPIRHLWNCRATTPPINNHQTPFPSQSQSCIVSHHQESKEHHIFQGRWKDKKANLLTFKSFQQCSKLL